MTFAERIAIARAHEQRVIQSLIMRGWLAETFGQAMLSDEMRNHLRKVKTSVRWMPDIIAAKTYPSRELIVFIDAKAGKKYLDTGNHDLENAALESAEKWIELSGDRCPYYFIFDDGGVTTPADIRETGRPGKYVGNGSGTPFTLFPQAQCRSFEAVFGPFPVSDSEGNIY